MCRCTSPVLRLIVKRRVLFIPKSWRNATDFAVPPISTNKLGLCVSRFGIWLVIFCNLSEAESRYHCLVRKGQASVFYRNQPQFYRPNRNQFWATPRFRTSIFASMVENMRPISGLSKTAQIWAPREISIMLMRTDAKDAKVRFLCSIA